MFQSKRVMHRFGYLLHRERLGQERNIVEADRFAQLLLGISGHEEQPDVAKLPAQIPRHRGAVHIGHHDIGHDQIIAFAVSE